MATLFRSPLRLLRGVTVHRVQGQSLAKMTVTLSAKEHAGVTYTALSRGTTVESVVLQNPFDNRRLVDKINAFREKYPIADVEERIKRCANATALKWQNNRGELFNVNVATNSMAAGVALGGVGGFQSGEAAAATVRVQIRGHRGRARGAADTSRGGRGARGGASRGARGGVSRGRGQATRSRGGRGAARGTAAQ